MSIPFKQKYTNLTFPYGETKKSKLNISSFAQIKKGGEDPRETSGVSTLLTGKLNYNLKSGGTIYGQGTLINKTNTRGSNTSENIKAVEVGYQTKKYKLGFELGKVSGSGEGYQFKSPITPKIKLSINI